MADSPDSYVRIIPLRLHDAAWQLLRKTAIRLNVTEETVMRELISRYAEKLEHD